MKKNLSKLLPLLVMALFSFAKPAQAAKQIVCPTNADLAGYYTQGQLCVAVYFSETVCNDVLFVGTYNNWSTNPTECAKFQPLVGFDGWYVVAVTDNSTNIEGKPIQLASDGSFSWNYQTGDVDSWTLVSGYVSITSAYSGESNLTHYDTSTPVILISDYFKNHNSPCGDVQHTYTVNLKAPICGNFTPAIIGDFNLWATGVAMTYNAATGTYSHTFTGNEGETFKFLAYGYDDWSNELLIYQDGFWITNPNITLTDQLTYTIDYSEGKYALCEDEIYSLTYKIENGEAILTGYTGTVPEAIEIPATTIIDGTVYDVTSIGSYAFGYCSSLTSITIPNSVTSIGYYAFYECSSLTSITIPNSVTSIDAGAFSGCSSLPVVDNLRYADTYLVGAVDKSLNTYTIKAGTKWIGNSAFSGCFSLTSVSIPNSVTSIEDGAFSGCPSLTSITIPYSVTSIGYGAFGECTSLTSILVESGNTIYDSRDNCNAIIETATNTLIAGCQTTIIPNSVTSIGGYAFYYSSSLTSLTIPNSVTSIGEWSFGGCSNITSLSIPESVTSIGYYAFAYCSSLAYVSIGKSVNTIEEGGFAECVNIQEMHSKAIVPPVVGEDAFSNVNRTIPVYVPQSVLTNYQSAEVWLEFNLIGEEEISTAIEETTANDHLQNVKKLLRNSQVLILRNGVTYDMMGQTL